MAWRGVARSKEYREGKGGEGWVARKKTGKEKAGEENWSE